MKNDGLWQEDMQKTEFMNYLNLFSASISLDAKQKIKMGKINTEPGFHNLQSQTRQEIYCLECQRSGDLLMCDQCENTYHLVCLSLNSVPSGQWLCPQCVHKKASAPMEDWPDNLALVHSYVMLKTAKEEEKKRLCKQLDDLREERNRIQAHSTALKETLVMKLHEKCELLETCNSAKKILGVMKAFVHLVQSSTGL